MLHADCQGLALRCVVLHNLTCCGVCAQVACPFTGPIDVSINEFRAEKGGYLKLALRNVAGTGGIKSVALRVRRVM